MRNRNTSRHFSTPQSKWWALICACFLMMTLVSPAFSMLSSLELSLVAVESSVHDDRSNPSQALSHAAMPIKAESSKPMSGHAAHHDMSGSSNSPPCDHADCENMSNCSDSCTMSTCVTSPSLSGAAMCLNHIVKTNQLRSTLSGKTAPLARTIAPLFRPPII